MGVSISMFELSKSKKGQVWSLDLIVAVSIFLIGIIVLFFYALNYTNQSQNNLEYLYLQGHTAGEILLSEDSSGILSNGIINQTKLEIFYDKNYAEQKSVLGVKDDFYITLDDLVIDSNPVNFVGEINESNVNDLIKINRIVAYRNKPSKLQMYIWRTR